MESSETAHPSPLYIVVCGIKRSGSTWMANAIRIICEEAGLKVWLGEHRPDMMNHPSKGIAATDWEGYDVVINKIHPFIGLVLGRADLVFSSYRDIHEVMSSWDRFRHQRGEPAAQYLYHAWCFWYYQWSPYVNWEMPYTLLLRSPTVVVENLIAVLLMKRRTEFKKVNPLTVMERLKTEVVPPRDKDYDPKTLLFQNHITSET